MKKAQQKFISLSKKYRTPKQVQEFLRKMPYNNEMGNETLHSATEALKNGPIHCFEATFIAAAILEQRGYPPLVLSIESQDGLGHVVFVFKEKGKWGSIGRSRDEGLHGRPPVFRSIRDLVWSYFEPYVDLSSKVTEYQFANLDDSKTDWRYSLKNVWKAEKYLVELKHKPLKSSLQRYKKLIKRYKKNGPIPLQKNWW